MSAFVPASPASAPARNAALSRASVAPRSVTTRTAPRRRSVLSMADRGAPPAMPPDAAAAKARGEPVQYWEGDWVCVDCGYVYGRGEALKFEDLPPSWKCPQCKAPKRRFAKKAGDYVQETGSTSNTPIIVVSLLGLVAMVAFGFWAASNL